MHPTWNVGPVQIEFLQDYAEWLTVGRYNWRNFDVIGVRFEDEACLGNCELHLALFGLHLRISWFYDRDTPMRKEIERRLDDWLERKGVTDSSPAGPPDAP